MPFAGKSLTTINITLSKINEIFFKGICILFF